MERFKKYLYLHLCILLFSMTEVFGKFAANEYKVNGLHSPKVFLLIAAMLFVCVMYAFCWQKIIKHFELHTAYANRAMYLVWSQIWAFAIFSEHITLRNIVGMLIVMTGVILVSTGDADPESADSTEEVA